MKQRLLFAVAFGLLLALPGLWAQKAEAVYTSGRVDLKKAGGKLSSLEIGTRLAVGDSVLTSKDGRAELKLLPGGASLKVRPSSVLLIGEKNFSGQSQTALQVLAGSVSMKFEKLVEKEPLVGTGACVAAIRGTEVEVYAAMDGSTLLAVISGAVSLESGGVSVDLAADEAVEVRPGQAPGPKFAWLGREKDFSAWNRGRLEAFLADPLSAALEVEAQLADYRASLKGLLADLAAQTALYDTAMGELKSALEAKDEGRVATLRKEKVFPLTLARATIFLNVRFYALSALSLRRFALGDMYLELKSRHPLDLAAAYAPYLEAHRRILADFETTFVPQLVEADI